MRRIGTVSSACLVFVFCFGATGTLPAQTVSGSIPGISATGLAVNPLTNKLYAADYLVFVVDGATNIATPINVGDAFRPYFVSVDPTTNKVLVSDYGNGGTLGGYTVIDAYNDDFFNGYISDGTYGVAVNPITHRAYFTENLGGEVILDELNDAVKFLKSGLYLLHLAVNPTANTIYTAYAGSGIGSGILITDGATNTSTRVTDVHVGYPTGIAVNPVTNKAYATFEPENDLDTNSVMF